MTERRQAARREPIEVEVRGTIFVAEPLPWQIAGDLGGEIVMQNARALNESVRLFVEDDAPQLELRLAMKISDWASVLKIAYPKNDLQEFDGFDIDEVATLVLASLEVNHLSHLNHLVDPNLNPQMTIGGNGTSEATPTAPGEKTESTLDSSSEALIEKLSSK